MVDYIYIQTIMKSAGEIMRQQRKDCDIYVKGKSDFVTAVDLKVQEYIFNSLREKYPWIGFIGEENSTDMDDKIENQKFQWILDPIDGTTNYIYGYNLSAISLALKDSDKIVWGAVYNPFTDEMFSAKRGEGAYLNGQQINVTIKKDLSECLVAVGTSPYYKEIAENVFRKITEIYKQTLDIRRTGSAALDLAYVASGRQDAYFEYNLKLWDYAAGAIILEEAGGIISDVEGEKPTYVGISNIVASCNEDIQKEILSILKS
ncbi:MAG: inositol monophosphatase [Lachnospiraceae bacterium]|nr:inositol monophosphatase [Lachnospiraceae bacterium]